MQSKQVVLWFVQSNEDVQIVSKISIRKVSKLFIGQECSSSISVHIGIHTGAKINFLSRNCQKIDVGKMWIL